MAPGGGHGGGHHHHERDDLAGEYPGNHTIQQISLLMFFAAWITDSFVLGYTTFPAGHVPLLLRITVGAVIMILGLWTLRSGLNTVFGKERKKPRVVTHGPFSVVRHPVYLGVVLFYLGLLVMTLSLLTFLVWCVVVGLYYFISWKEEELLVDKFGGEYERYRRRVPMLLPVPKFR
jgi:protein-S-isoprenylcysteine O-methyltransferase Ste14